MASDGFHYKTKEILCSVQTSVYLSADGDWYFRRSQWELRDVVLQPLECCILMSAQTSQGLAGCRVLLTEGADCGALQQSLSII